MMGGYEVTLVNDNMQEFFIKFYGPKDSNNFALFLINFLFFLLKQL